MAKITEAQYDALKWLSQHNGDGLFDKEGVLLAAGERAPVMRSTWNALRDVGLVEFYLKKRVRLSVAGKAVFAPAVRA